MVSCSVKMSFWRLDIPNSGCSDDSNEEDATPAERVRRLEDEDVLEEERVQLCQLWPEKMDERRFLISVLYVYRSVESQVNKRGASQNIWFTD